MKIFLFLLILFIPLTLFSQVEPEPFKLTWYIIVGILAGVYDVFVRIIPTVKNYSFIGKIIEILLWVSNFLNNKKKRK
jgi:hypothetical protein